MYHVNFKVITFIMATLRLLHVSCLLTAYNMYHVYFKVITCFMSTLKLLHVSCVL
jgi:hypothetical protein